MMTPEQYVQDKAAKSGSSFYYSFLFLPPERRRAITALYAFCREVDDVVDEIRDKSVAASKLAWWRLEVERLFAGEPTHPVTITLASSNTSEGTLSTAALTFDATSRVVLRTIATNRMVIVPNLKLGKAIKSVRVSVA